MPLKMRTKRKEDGQTSSKFSTETDRGRQIVVRAEARDGHAEFSPRSSQEGGLRPPHLGKFTPSPGEG